MELRLSEQHKLLRVAINQMNGPFDGKHIVGLAFLVVRSGLYTQVTMRNEIADATAPGSLYAAVKGCVKSYGLELPRANGLLHCFQRNLLERGRNAVVRSAI